MSEGKPGEDPVIEQLALLGRATDIIRLPDARLANMFSDARAEAARRTTLPVAVWQLRAPALVLAAVVVVAAGAFAWRTEPQHALRAGSSAFVWSEL